MKVHEFISWLEKQDQNLEVCVVEYEEGSDWCYDGQEEVYKEYTTATAVCFDDPDKQSSKTQFSLILGVER